MEASESDSSNNGEVKSNVVPQTPEDLLQDRSISLSENQHLSIFSLTLDEFQSRSGMSFASMNFDEFLNSVTSEIEFQVSSNVNQELVNNENGIAAQTGLPRQGSLSVPTQLCSITIDEVWAEIQQNNHVDQENHGHGHQEAFPSFSTNDELLPLQSLGEMTLEEFLIKAGVIKESPNNDLPLQQGGVLEQHLNINHSISYITSNSTFLDTTSISVEQVMDGYEFSTPPSNCDDGNGNTLISDHGSSVYPMLALDSGGCVGGEPTNNVENQICKSPSNAGETSSKRKRSAAPMEMNMERRQRRMIRNRESAARSRARKQAYAEALEKELTQQREENESLKLALKEAESKLIQELSNEHDLLMKKKLRTIRRTISSSW